MSEEDKLFNFMSGLQPWAQMELRRQNVKDLPSAFAAADGLVDFKLNKDAGPSKGKGKGLEKKSGKKKSGDKGKADGQSSGSKFLKGSQGCFLCNGPHRARDCPKREKLTALVSEDDHAPVVADSGNSAVMNPMHLVNAISGVSPLKGLLYVNIRLNSAEVLAIADTGALHNFLAERMAKTLGLEVTKSSNRMKAVNSAARDVIGMAANVVCTVGDWAGYVNFLVVPLDDFDLILGNDFFMRAKVAVVPHLNGLFILDELRTCFVQGKFVPKDECDDVGKVNGVLSATQVENGLRRGEETFLAALLDVKPDRTVEVPDQVAELLRQFADVMPPELPPRRTIDHKIELVPGSQPFAHAPYRMSPLELAKLRKQLNE